MCKYVFVDLFLYLSGDFKKIGTVISQKVSIWLLILSLGINVDVD